MAKRVFQSFYLTALFLFAVVLFTWGMNKLVDVTTIWIIPIIFGAAVFVLLWQLIYQALKHPEIIKNVKDAFKPAEEQSEFFDQCTTGVTKHPNKAATYRTKRRADQRLAELRRQKLLPDGYSFNVVDLAQALQWTGWIGDYVNEYVDMRESPDTVWTIGAFDEQNTLQGFLCFVQRRTVSA